MKSNRSAFSLIETMVALVILTIIISLVSGVQFSSVYRVSRINRMVHLIHRLKKELLGAVYSKNASEKIETIDDEKNDLKIVFSLDPQEIELEHEVKITSLKRLTARATWYCWNERQQTALGCLWYSPEEDDEQE